MGKRPSLTRQIEFLLSGALAVGHSRHHDKHGGVDTERKVYSWGSFRSHLQRLNTFARWCQRHHGLRWLRDITPDMVVAYLAHLEAEERSANYRRSMLASIRKLEKLMLDRGWIS